ncbi:MAG: undecaprenyldiphospho-muramoylpentapeptide beta-N-acetylglucosaminyltransferase [Bacteroidetes bacterium]|nr:undecaprenyldiphospho-muramoylpentapeptide beta-N-acetylglucosaminyltransferase [Bacteroidota bacterium]MDA1225174.1 undecaprenyldiphospho-muramoylpentapeptide beta-N-acetylglucosaminyltransferase [Bacteroidota bacterium]
MSTSTKNTTPSQNPPKFILSGGGTGGHIFPAVAIANALKIKFSGAQFLFVGAIGKMEMEKVPKEGFEIVGLPIEGLKRSASPRNIIVLLKTIQSFWKARKILRNFQPTAVIGTGGYASLPVCFMASRMGYITILQEQNGFAGLTNRLVASRAALICTGFPSMERFFPAGSWEFTGNPVRQNIIDLGKKLDSTHELNSENATCRQKFGLQPNLPVLFITGGSLGSRTINQTIFNNLVQLAEANIQIIWQMGLPFAKSHAEKIHQIIESNPALFLAPNAPRIFHAPFIYDMDDAYQASDLVVSRAGAISISEIAVVGKPSILVPSPNVTDDHQTKNAQVLSELNAAMLITDKDAPQTLINTCIQLIKDTKKMSEMQEKLKQIAKPQATETIANRIASLIEKANP